MPFRFLPGARALALVSALAVGAASAATLPLNYVADAGDPAITITGSVSFDDAIWTPNQNIFGGLAGLTAVSITVSGPGVPGGTQTFTLADMDGWVFRTNGLNQVVDLNFFANAKNGCFVSGFEVFLLGYYCDPDGEEDFLTLKGLVLVARGPTAPVPALDPAAIVLLALLLAATVPALRRRRR